MKIKLHNSSAAQSARKDHIDRALSTTVNALLLLLSLSPELALAAQIGGDPFGGITDFLRTVANLLIFEWGYYIGIITLGIQGYRWKTGRIDLLQLGGWGLGIALVFFAPSIVSDLRSRAGAIA